MIRKYAASLRQFVTSELDFISSLLLYSALVTLFSSMTIYIVENAGDGPPVKYRNALFMAISVYSSTGLSVDSYCSWTPVSQGVLIVVSQLGSMVLMTTLPSLIRLRSSARERRRLMQTRELFEGDFAAMSRIDEAAEKVSQNRLICWLIIATCFSYWFIVQLLAMLLLWRSMSFGWAAFIGMSAFNNVGVSLSPMNFSDWITNYYVLVVTMVVSTCGNALFPVIFRGIVAAIDRALHSTAEHRILLGQTVSEWRSAAREFLAYPRRYYTHMFTFRDTLILFTSWVLFTAVEFSMFLPELDTPTFPANMTLTDQVAVAGFQTVAVRSSGFSAVKLDAFLLGHIAYLIISMYFSAFPFIIATRLSAKNDDGEVSGGLAAYRKQVLNLIGRDLLWLYLAVVAISFSEGSRTDGHQDQTFIRIIFEVFSAFSNVGLSLPIHPASGISFSGSLGKFSRYVILALMWFGKHRGLPPTVDKSLLVHCKDLVDIEFEVNEDGFVELHSIATSSTRFVSTLRSHTMCTTAHVGVDVADCEVDKKEETLLAQGFPNENESE